MKTSKDIATIGLIAICGYIATQILSDIGSLKIATLFGFSIDGGTFLYPITFTLRDLIHKQFGKITARKVILFAGIINLLMVAFFQILTRIPADSSWTLNNEFTLILGAVWRITIASIIAEIFSELVDTEAYQFFIDKISKRFQWGRVLFSNAIALPIDSIIFAFIAFFGILPMSVIWSIVLSNIIVKGVITLFSVPLIYAVPERED